MSVEWAWWIVAAALVGVELLTGTFYLLAVGMAVAFGGVAAYAGASLPLQFTVAGLLGIILTVVAHRMRLSRGTPPLQPSLDIGQAVRVETWNADGTARVSYRGTSWDADPVTADVPHAATMYIVAMRGSRLVLSDRRPAA